MELDLELGLLAFRVSSFLEIILFIYLFIYGCAGSLLLCGPFF